MPYKIESIRSPSHPLLIKKTETKATVCLNKKNEEKTCKGLEENFVMLITLSDVNRPRMWVEKSSSDGHQAAMLAFYPNFEYLLFLSVVLVVIIFMLLLLFYIVVIFICR